MSKTEETAIKVENISKGFVLPHEKSTSIKSLALNPFRRRSYEKQEVLRDVSFNIKKGEFFGIVGRNGSGKSTLLKLLAEIYTPDKGNIQVRGQLTPFIELGVGFNPELTGRENVFLNGALLGFSRKEMTEMYDEIVKFAELEKFMDQQLKNYSSGMQVRLAFSIAIRANTGILVLDEVLAVGDANFQRKCLNYFEELKRGQSTVVLVTHDMSAVVNFCNRALFLEEGKVKFIGDSSDVAEQYFKSNINKQKTSNGIRTKDSRADILQVSIIDEDKMKVDDLKPNKKYKIIVEVDIKEKIDNVGVGFSVKNSGGVPVIGYNSYFDNNKTKKILSSKGVHVIEYEFDNILKNGNFIISAGIHIDNVSSIDGSYHLEPLTVNDSALEFVSSSWNPPGTLVAVEAKKRIVR